MSGAIAEALKTLRELLPKQSVSATYLDMLSLALDMSESAINDVILNRKRFGLKIDHEELMKKQEDLFKYHLKNQIEILANKEKR